MHKKGHKLKTSPLVKNPQFSSNLADIQAKLPTHEVIILTKFHKECKKIVDFLLRQKFLACTLFCASPFTCKKGTFGVLTVHEHKSTVDYVAKTAIISESTMNNIELIKDFIYCQLTI